MKLSLERLARAIGDSRADFYSFYAPSWATPEGLAEMRRRLVIASCEAPSEARPAGTVHALRPRTRRPASQLSHAA